jgi:hypothetical protein
LKKSRTVNCFKLRQKEKVARRLKNGVALTGISHTIRMTLPVRSGAGFTQGSDEPFAVGVVMKDRLALVATRWIKLRI